MKTEVNIEILLQKSKDLTDAIRNIEQAITKDDVVSLVYEFGNIAYELGRKDSNK